MNIANALQDFYKQSERVLAVTHKPKSFEYRQMALTTAIGIAFIGIIGFFINVVAHYLR